MALNTSWSKSEVPCRVALGALASSVPASNARIDMADWVVAVGRRQDGRQDGMMGWNIEEGPQQGCVTGREWRLTISALLAGYSAALHTGVCAWRRCVGFWCNSMRHTNMCTRNMVDGGVVGEMSTEFASRPS